MLRDAVRSGNVVATCGRYEVLRALCFAGASALPSTAPMASSRSGVGGTAIRPPAVSVQDERRVIDTALAWPTCGPQFVSDWLAREGRIIAGGHGVARAPS